MTRQSWWLGCLVAVLALSACTEDGDGPADFAHETIRSTLARDLSPEVDPVDLAALARGNLALSLDLYQQTAEAGKNSTVSAYSVQQAFALVLPGAKGETAAQIAQTLYFGDDTAVFHAGMNAIDLALASRNMPAAGEYAAVELHVANAFWGQRDYPWLTDYLDVIATNYGAGIEAVDFHAAPEAARQHINRWVEIQTRDRIKDLLPEGSVGGDTAAVLTNALYLKAPWNKPFSKGATQPGTFTRNDASTVEVPFMSTLEGVGYAEGAGWQAMEKDLRGGKLSMLFILPGAGDFEAFDASLDVDVLEGIVAAIAPRGVNMRLPKFNFDASFRLGAALQALGMVAPFGAGADFTGMILSPSLLIDEVYHKTFVAIDEDGVEAAAATGIVMRETSAVPPDVDFVANRPFFFAIRDKDTGVFLFFGRVMDPSAE